MSTPIRVATAEEIGVVLDSMLEALVRRMPNSSAYPSSSVYLLYEAGAAVFTNFWLNETWEDGVEALQQFMEQDREEPIRPEPNPKAYLPLTSKNGERPHSERFPEGIDLDAPIPKETWPCIADEGS